MKSLVHRRKKDLAVPESQRWMNIQKAAEHTCSHPNFWRELIRKGKIKFRKIGHGYILDRLDIDCFMEKMA